MSAATLSRHSAHHLAAYRTALQQPDVTQWQLLAQILTDNRNTPFGQAHGFATIQSPEQYAERIPLHTYEDFQTAFAHIAAKQGNPLTAEEAILFEETGGSTGGAKLIPYTASLLSAFRRATGAWLGSLAQHYPQAFSGNLFFIISPSTRAHTHTVGGIPIGNGSDLNYLDAPVAELLAPQTLFLPELMQAQSAQDWQIASATLLAQHPNLSLMSAWSPTLLLNILHTLQQQQELILPRITHPDRRRLLCRALSHNTPDTRAIWPKLALVSAWCSHTASAPAAQLHALLPHAAFQGKGLLATEAVSTLPFGKQGQTLPALTAHYCEFIDNNGNSHRASQLQDGNTYRLAVTTQGGLYRYDTGDMLMAEANGLPVPTLHFIGRNSLVSDLCGEKLTEAFVANAMRQIDPRLLQHCLLQGLSKPCGYCIIAPHSAQSWLCNNLVAALDQALSANPQYHYARRIGQLGALTINYCPSPTNHALAFARQEQRLGTRKVPLLLPPI